MLVLTAEPPNVGLGVAVRGVEWFVIRLRYEAQVEGGKNEGK